MHAILVQVPHWSAMTGGWSTGTVVSFSLSLSLSVHLKEKETLQQWSHTYVSSWIHQIIITIIEKYQNDKLFFFFYMWSNSDLDLCCVEGWLWMNWAWNSNFSPSMTVHIIFQVFTEYFVSIFFILLVNLQLYICVCPCTYVY